MYFSIDGQPADNDGAIAHRQRLVEQFNALFGVPGPVNATTQQEFVSGRMPYDAMVSYVRYCKFMIDAATK